MKDFEGGSLGDDEIVVLVTPDYFENFVTILPTIDQETVGEFTNCKKHK